MSKVNEITKKIENLLMELGFSLVCFERNWLDEPERNYALGSLHCRADFFGSCFVIEYADSFDDAKSNVHEDGKRFPLEMGEEAILAGIKNELLLEIEKLNEHDRSDLQNNKEHSKTSSPLIADMKIAV